MESLPSALLTNRFIIELEKYLGLHARGLLRLLAPKRHVEEILDVTPAMATAIEAAPVICDIILGTCED